MSNRIMSPMRTPKAQVLHMLDHNELSFQELAWNLHQDENRLSDNLQKLVDDGVIVRKFHHNDVMYTRAHFAPLRHALHVIGKRLH